MGMDFIAALDQAAGGYVVGRAFCALIVVLPRNGRPEHESCALKRSGANSPR